MFERRLVAACLLLGFAGAPALAQVPAGRPVGEEQAVLQQACTGDFITLCPGVDPASNAVEACFDRNMAQLTPVCHTAINAYKQRSTTRPKG